MALPPPERPAPRLTGAASLLQALRNLGLLGPVSTRSAGGFAADDAHWVPVQRFGSRLDTRSSPAPKARNAANADNRGPQARPVVLLHGLGCTHQHWAPVARRLAPAHPVIVWSARGHGPARPLAGSPVTLPRLARDLANLIAHYGLEQPVLVGHSMGAMVVMQYLQDFGASALSAACLVDQSPRVVTDPDWSLGLWGSCSADMLTELIARARDDLPTLVLREAQTAVGSGWLARTLAPQGFVGRRLGEWLRGKEVAPLLDLCHSLVAADFRPTLARLNLPLLVVLGCRSAHYQRVPLADYYRHTVPGAELRTYERSGHSPHVAEPERFARDLMAFVQTVE